MCTATRYARPHVLFSDGVYYRVVLELRVDDRRKIKKRQAGGHQILFPADAVHVRAVWVRPNAPPCVAEERLSSWNPELEALPARRQAPQVVRNQRNLDARPWTGVTVAADARYPPPALPWLAYVDVGHGERAVRCLMCQKQVGEAHEHGEEDDATGKHKRCM